jgi:hypothetical protein
MKLADVKVDDKKYANISLSKLMGKPVKDIEGSLSMEFGDITFKLNKVVFEDGSDLHCEGEHDMPYLTDGYGVNATKLPTEAMDALYEEEHA